MLENVVMLLRIRGFLIKLVYEKVCEMLDEVGFFYCVDYLLLIMLGGE